MGQVLIFHMRDRGVFEWWTKRGDPCSLYVDDTVIFVQNVEQIPLLLETIHHIGEFTGLTLNVAKTIAYAFGDKSIVDGVVVDSKPVKYLGAFLGLGDLSAKNFEKPLKNARNNLQSWNKRHLIIPARVVIAKTFIASLFIHVLNTVHIHTQQLQIIQNLLNDFL